MTVRCGRLENVGFGREAGSPELTDPVGDPRRPLIGVGSEHCHYLVRDLGEPSELRQVRERSAHGFRLVTGQRLRPGKNEVGHGAESVTVRRRRVASRFSGLGGKVTRGSHHPSQALAIRKASGQTEVDKHTAVFSHQNVGGFDVPVHYRHATGGSSRMHEVKGSAHRYEHLEVVNWITIGSMAYPLVQRIAFNPVHH
jgi:hypothetical protein